MYKHGLGDYTLAVNVVGRLPATSGLWGQSFTAIAGALGPVGWAVVAGIGAYSLVRMFTDWFQRGELKIAATATAEEYVQSVWGTLEPNSPPQSDSVSKLIEECRLNEAQSMITFLARQMYEKGNADEYFKRWVDEWGFITLKQIQSKLDAYLGYCQNTDEPVEPPAQTTQCPPGFKYESGRCIPLSCPPGFQLVGARCEMVSPPVLPPAINNEGEYVPLPKSSFGGVGMFGLFAVALAAIVISRR